MPINRLKEMEKNGEGVRKGAWTKEEDFLLKSCIEKHGEGKWHKVPHRAGLNRCRKSCRLRWLNYLRPNLKRGYFTKDEVDLMLRLHKLLGNRWSLIAGRLPGRTPNDVKNFWNTHIAKKSAAARESCKGSTVEKTITRDNIFKPRPWTFSKLQGTANCPGEVNKTNATTDENLKDDERPSSSTSFSQEGPNDWTNNVENPINNQPFPVSEGEVDECIRWWCNLLETTENGEGIPFSFSGDNGPIMQPIYSPGLSGPHENNQANQDGLNSLSIDADANVWELINFDDQ